MMKIKDYFKTKEPLLFFLTMFFSISPGVVYLFLWQQELFMQLDWVKLILISISVLLPVSFVNTIAQLTFENKEPSYRGQELVDAFTMNSVFTGFIFLIGLVVAYASEFSLKIVLLFCEAVLIGTIFVEAKRSR